MTDHKTVLICAGEASGDMHGAELVHKLKKIQPKLHVKAMGGQHLRKAGCEIMFDSTNIAVMGLIEILAHWSDIQMALKTMKNILIKTPPDLLILIDYPEFNLKLAKTAKAQGIKVLFYISPQVWAWRPHRVKKIGQVIDTMAVIFPFETAVYEAEHIPVRFVGHPLAGKVKATLSREQAIQQFGLHTKEKTVGLFPGSRRSEITRILPTLIAAAHIIHQHIPNTQFVLPIAPTLNRHFIEQHIPTHTLPLTLLENSIYDVINTCDSIITASGTATLEIALMGKPMAIVYRVTAFSYFIMSRMIRIDHIGLANIVAGKRIVPEFIQHSAKPELIAAEIIRQLTDKHYSSAIASELAAIKEKLEADNRGNNRLAELVVEMLQDI